MVAGVCFLLLVSLTASAVITAVEHRGNERQARNQKDLGTKFPEVKDSIAALDVENAIIDGEIVALDEKGRSSFQLLQGFDMGEQKPPIVFYAFDLLRLNGKDLRNPRIEERKAKLEELLTTGRRGDQIVLYLFFAAFSPKWPATEILSMASERLKKLGGIAWLKGELLTMDWSKF